MSVKSIKRGDIEKKEGIFVEKNVIKNKNNILNGPIWSNILLFAVPIALTAILEQLFNASDIAVVGNFTGELKNVAMAAVGANTPIIALIVNFFIGFSLGANVVIAKAYGEGKKNFICESVHTSIILSLISGLIIGGIGEISAPFILKSLQVPSDVYPLALAYLRIYFIGLPMILLYNFEAAIFRSIGKTKTPLIALAISGVLNIILNLFFVIVLNMNVAGVALATVISNVISSVILFVILLKTKECIKVEIKKIRIYKKSLIEIFKIGFPSGAQGALFAISNIVIQLAINTLGADVMAGSSAAYNVEVFAYYIFNSFSQACTTFTSQNYGAGNYARCKKIYGICLLEDLIATVSSIALILLIGRPLLAIFNDDKNVIAIGYSRLVVIFAGYIFSMTYEVTAGYLRGYGKSLVPAILTAIGICVVRVIWIIFVFPTHNSFNTILLIYPISLFITAVLMVIALIVYRPTHRLISLSNNTKS